MSINKYTQLAIHHHVVGLYCPGLFEVRHGLVTALANEIKDSTGQIL